MNPEVFMQVIVVTEDASCVAKAAGMGGKYGRFVQVRIAELSAATVTKAPALVDVDLSDRDVVAAVKRHMPPGDRTGPPRVVMVEPAVRDQIVAAASLGATHILPRPLTPEMLFKALFGVDRPDMPGLRRHSEGVDRTVEQNRMVIEHLLENPDCPVGTLALVEEASDATVDSIASGGLAQWIEAVFQHHSATYRHCMLVNGVAVAFGQTLGFRRSDLLQLSVAATVHDIGKARIPIAILDKPGRLTPEEEAIVRQHPQHGLDMLGEQGEFSAAVTDVVIHHHEMMDGSGYPHGLKRAQISDLTHLVTIADIFSALVERRAYKEPMPLARAFEILNDMQGKLDAPLVKAFAGVVADCPDPEKRFAAAS